MRSYRIPDKMMRVIAGIRGLWLRSCRRECNIRKVYDQVWGTTRVRDVRNTILTVLGLGHEEGKSRQEKRERWYFTTVEHSLCNKNAARIKLFLRLHIVIKSLNTKKHGKFFIMLKRNSMMFSANLALVESENRLAVQVISEIF